jgi:hypothetical protein
MSRITTILVLVLGVSGASLLAAQSGTDEWGPGTRYGRLYNPQTVVSLAGEVLAVDRFTPSKGAAYGVHLTLDTGVEKIAVHLGPVWYIERQDLKFAAGDRIEVRGSRITFQGKSAIIAAVVTKGNRRLELRNPSSGVPLWSRGKRK